MEGAENELERVVLDKAAEESTPYYAPRKLHVYDSYTVANSEVRETHWQLFRQSHFFHA